MSLWSVVVCAVSVALTQGSSAAANVSRCVDLAQLSPSVSSKQFISVAGQECTGLVYASAGPARAAAALLLAMLRHVLRYSEMQLAEGPRQLTGLMKELKLSKNTTTLALVPTAVWEWRSDYTPMPQCDSQHDGFCGLGGPQLVVIQKGAAPSLVRAHVYLSAAARPLPACAHAHAWTFYHNEGALRNCSFDFAEDSRRVTMFVSAESNRDVPELLALAESILGASLPVRLQPLARAALADRLRRAGARSFLFADWDMWQGTPGVTPMDAAPCACTYAPCAPLENMVVVRAANERLFKYAPYVFSVTRKFAPEPEELREILELEARVTHGDIEEAACHWALDHRARIHRWLYTTVDKMAMVYYCNGEPQFRDHGYKKVNRFLTDELWNITKNSEFGIRIATKPLNCTNEAEALSELDYLTHSTQYYTVIGLVAGGKGAAALVEQLATQHLPLLTYDLNTNGTHSVLGSVADIVAVLHRFITDADWKRIAVLSEDSRPARDLVTELKLKGVCVRDIVTTVDDAEHALQRLKSINARVLLLNMHAEAAAKVLKLAADMGMKPDQGYAWISREWANEEMPQDMRLFVVSSACRMGHSESHTTLRKHFDKAWGTRWPLRIPAYTDAVLALGRGFYDLQLHHPQFKDDLHGVEYERLFWEALAASNVSGICQKLRYENYTLAEALVFVEELTGDGSEPVATWRVRRGNLTLVTQHRSAYRGARAPLDGRSGCIVPSDDCFAPRCYDLHVAIGCIVLVLILVVVAYTVMWLRHALWRRLRQFEHDIRQNEATRRDQVVLSLASYLVPHEQLELRELLGSGRSGRVHLALLRTPDRKPRAVAVKSLRENSAPSEESEFLREACTLASLDHVHVVRLVGVCTGDPLLVLMDHAFFGDLLHYLRSRRHLVEGVDVDASAGEGGVGPEEAVHVSAEALTRLVREAASALAYLAHHGLVHRDVRAANCLVDARRSLKLGDFGMARKVRDEGAGGEAEYACRRRGMFPVLWMAPESLERGAFSAASDVWSLGVLVLEVVTLGARPYGSWSPVRVLQYVANGGRPRLPLDATPQTRGVALSCWRRAPRERPPASALVAYLADHARALGPALAPDWDAPDVDSGYGDPEAADSPDSPDSFDRPSPDSGTAFFPA